jgi:hypothetical protein
VVELQDRLAGLGSRDLGVVLKIETREAFGPHLLEAVQVLDDILRRMQGHQSKKRSMMRRLAIADHFGGERG